MTPSEILFERFCQERNVGFRRIGTTETKTPDYEIRLASGPVAVEIKQLEPGDSDRELLNRLREEGTVGYWVNTGRPRDALRGGSKQLRAYARGVMPGLVVLFDTAGGLLGYLGADSIGHSMYGQRRVHISTSGDNYAEVVGTSFGGGRVATEQENTTLSAVGVMRLFQNNTLSLTIYHNRYAARPLDTNCLRIRDVEQFAWAETGVGAMPNWTRV